jgi:RHS repeat-associated protein
MRLKKKLHITLLLFSFFTVLSKVYADEGFYYHINDHLGNCRVIIDEQGVVQKAYDYYPFGMQLRAYQPGDAATFTFTGKQLDEDGGLDWYYFGARFYDPEVGRFLGVDPLAHKYPSLNPYHYTMNNPLRYVDPNGKQVSGDEEDQLEIERNMWTNFGKASEQALQEMPQTLKLSESSEEITKGVANGLIGISDATSDASNVAAVLGVVLAPVTQGTSLAITGTALTIGAVADVSSTLLKGADAAFFGGSVGDFKGQAFQTAVTVGSGKLLNSATAKAITRTSFSTGPVFRSAQSGRFVKNSYGLSVSAMSDATKVMIGYSF